MAWTVLAPGSISPRLQPAAQTGARGACPIQRAGLPRPSKRDPATRSHGPHRGQEGWAERGQDRVRPHAAFDGPPRAYTKHLPDEEALAAIGFLHRARALFAAHGITRRTLVVTPTTQRGETKPPPSGVLPGRSRLVTRGSGPALHILARLSAANASSPKTRSMPTCRPEKPRTRETTRGPR